jgi:AraC-like DNA-binding protein/mannose-6-phosphate isomerase-like protein (cupin superfamily)
MMMLESSTILRSPPERPGFRKEERMDRYELREHRIYADPGLPAGLYRLRGSDGLFQAHWHPDLELLLVLRGTAVFTVDGERLPTGPGSAVVVNAGELHAAEAVGGQPADVHALVFDPAFLCGPAPDACADRYLDPVRLGRLRLPRRLRAGEPSDAEPLRLLREIADRLEDPSPGYELALKGLLLQWFASFAADGRLLPSDGPEAGGLAPLSRRPPGAGRFESVKKSLAVIHGEYAGRLSVPRLAAAANLSEFHFYRVFREATGRSPVEYLNEYRCRRAAQLLSDTDAGILGIALDVGFSGAAYFIRTFRRYYGCTPSTYRKARKAPIPVASPS